MVHLGTIGDEVASDNHRVLRDVRVEQGAVVVVGSAIQCLGLVGGRCLERYLRGARKGVTRCRGVIGLPGTRTGWRTTTRSSSE